jgi:lysophospholipase L1-like esterase
VTGRKALGLALSLLLTAPAGAVLATSSAAAGVTAATTTSTTVTAATTAVRPTLVSRGVPAHASTSWSPARSANDDDYATAWRSNGVPAWLAYDLSRVPVERRQRVLVAWSNTSYGYDTSASPHYNNLGSYTIQTNSAPSGATAPVSGWVTKTTVTGNTLHSRQHLLELGGATWLRLQVTASDGSVQNTDASVNTLDVYDVAGATGALRDNLVFYGDSITAGAMCPCPQGGTASLPELLHQADPAAWPVVENGGVPFQDSAGAVRTLLGSTGRLSLFPGTHVGLSYGMNDVATGVTPEAFATNMRALVQAVLAAGKVPMVPTIPFTGDAARNAALPAYNAVIARLYTEFPQLLKGPDLWSSFKADPSLVAPGDIHPTTAGYAALRRQWATTLVAGAGRRRVRPGPDPVADRHGHGSCADHEQRLDGGVAGVGEPGAERCGGAGAVAGGEPLGQ